VWVLILYRRRVSALQALIDFAAPVTGALPRADEVRAFGAPEMGTPGGW
jgi:hypothetical protein